MRTLFIIPARAGSKRLPGKNTAEIAGIPLYMHTVNFALTVADVDRDSCVISSDILGLPDFSIENKFFVQYTRPESLSLDITSSNDTVVHAVNHALEQGRKFDLIVLLQVTSPLRTLGGYADFIKSITSKPHSSSFCHASYSRLPFAPYELGIISDNQASFKLLEKTSEFSSEEWHGQNLGYEDGCYYACFLSFMLDKSVFMNRDLCSFHYAERSFQVDIDSQSDFELAERLLN